MPEEEIRAPSVCVIIPVYRSVLPPREAMSLAQCVRILGHYQIVFVKPQSLRIDYILERCPGAVVESFDDEFFRGVDGYNRLMLSDHFYGRFSAYEFMLIHQLDAYVFTDELAHWCSQDYDYIGAPWITRERIEIPSSAFFLKRWIYQRLDVKDKRSGFIHRAQYGYLGGNGGFSLRRINKMREALVQSAEQLPAYLERAHHTCNEDVFFCVEANRRKSIIRLAPFPIALQFSWETNPAVARALMLGRLPFGCHGWDRHYQEAWTEIFGSIGINLRDIATEAESGHGPDVDGAI